MIEGGAGVLEGRGAIHASPTAIAERRELYSSLLFGGQEGTGAPQVIATRVGESDAMTVTTGHCTSLKKTTPRTGMVPVAGCRVMG